MVTDAPARRRRAPELRGATRLLAVAYGVFALVFGLITSAAQLRFAIGGCEPCWVAVPIMLTVAGVGAACLRAAVRAS